MSYSFMERFCIYDKRDFAKKLDILKSEIVKMDPEVKVRWLKALRSGEYKQGPSYLCYGDEYCCLGVLAQSENVEYREAFTSNGSPTTIKEFVFGDTTHDCMLPADAFGLTMKVQSCLAEFNDHFDMTFEEIATVVEDML